MYWKACFIVLFILSGSARIEALQTPVQTFTSEDGTFTFEFPQGWFVDVINPEYGPNTSITVDNLPLDERFENSEGITVQFSLPRRSYDLGFVTGATPREAVEKLIKSGSSQGAEVQIGTPSVSGTPQPLEIQSSVPSVQELLVDGRPGAYGYIVIQIATMNNLDASQLAFVVDLGNDFWILGMVRSFSGGLSAIQNSEASVLDVVRTMRYTPPPTVYSGNASLPEVFSGIVGIWRRGSIEFFYPSDWYVSDSLLLLLSNVPTSAVGNVQPQPGQVIAVIQGVDETRASVDPIAVMNQCGSSASDWTAHTVVAELLGGLTTAQLEQLQVAGITISQPESITVNGVEIVYFRQYQADYETLDMFIDLGDGNIPQMIATTHLGELAGFEPQLFEIASTFRYTPNPCPN